MADDLYESRMEICRNCPLFKIDDVYGPVCDKTKYISIIDKTSVSYLPKKDYVKGCGCKLRWKCKNEKAHCVVKKW